MTPSMLRKLRRALRNLPNLLEGYSIYVNRDKLDLIDMTFTRLFPRAKSVADLGGVWKVHGAYSLYALEKFHVEWAVLVDTDYPPELFDKLKRRPALETMQGDFADPAVVDKIGRVDVILFFDVLLHQANPDWDEVVTRYARNCPCFVIYNQQLVHGEETIRLTDLPLEKYNKLTSGHANDLTRYIYNHREEIHPRYGKPWKDVHNIAQWGITDRGLREIMTRLGFKEAFYRNYGMFSDLSAFENHGFVFLRP